MLIRERVNTYKQVNSMSAEQIKIVVVGSINMDMVTRSDRFPKKGETITGIDFSQLPGGKGANQAVACARLGAQVTMVGAVGSDHTGQALVEHLKQEQIDTTYIQVCPEVTTGMAQITVSEDDNHIIIVPGANHALTKEHIHAAEAQIKQADLMIVQLEVPLDIVQYAASLATEHGVKIILNPAPAQPLPQSLLKHIDYITPNETELVELTGEAEAQKGMNELISKSGGTVIVTLGSEGACFMQASEDGLTKVVGQKAKVVDTTGAGDTFNGALAVALAKESDLKKAVDFANHAAALSVTKFGAQSGMPTYQEVVQRLK